MGNFNRDRSFGGSKRSNFGMDNRDSRRPELFKTTCDECGTSCEVPFKPSNNKPVYCSDCFRGKESPRGERSFDNYGRDRGDRGDRGDKRMRNNFSSNSDRVMHKAVCSECGKECEIPFKPMNDKPIYCSDCFGKNNKGKNNSDSTKEFDNLNAKLDLIIKFFKISEIKEKSSNVKVKEESDKIEVKEEEVVKSKKKAPKKTEETKEIKIKKVVKNKKA